MKDSNSRDRPISVVIACHDMARWDSILTAISSLRGQEGVQVEVIVAVDHSTELFDRLLECDAADSVVMNHGQKGASATRNVGAHQAGSEIIAFLDDDAHADRYWLEHLLAPFDDERVIGAGGKVVPSWSGDAPRWLPSEFYWVVGASFTGMPTVTATVRNVWAENMAIRKHVFDAIGGFREAFGKVGTVSQPEDTDLCIRATDHSSGTWRYVPDAVVNHLVPEDRATFGFFVRRCHNEGRGKAALSWLLRGDGSEQSELDDENDYARRVLPSAALRYATSWPLDPANILRLGALTVGAVCAAAGYKGESRRLGDRVTFDELGAVRA